MRWLLITTIGRNPGDEWIRIGIQNVIREVDPESEYILLDKESPSNRKTQVEFDKCIWCGMPVFWSQGENQNCRISWWQELMLAWPSKRKNDFMVLGAGSFFPWGRELETVSDKQKLIQSAEDVLQRSFCVTARDEIVPRVTERPIPPIVCPAIFSILDFRKSQDLKLANIMPNGAHYTSFGPREASIWNEKKLRISEILRDNGFVFVAHSLAEFQFAQRLGWKKIIPYNGDPFGLLEYYGRCGKYFGNRVHGAIVARGNDAETWNVGYDSRQEAVRLSGAKVSRPSELDINEIEDWASREIEAEPFDMKSNFEKHVDIVRRCTLAGSRPLSDKLNIGCGLDYREGFVNVDGDSNLPKVDHVLDIKPGVLLEKFGQRSFNYILSKDFLEHHFHWEARGLLKDFHALLNRKGRIELSLPNIENIINDSTKGAAEKALWIYGGQDIQPDTQAKARSLARQKHPEHFCHKYGWTHDTIKSELFSAGFSNIEIIDDGWNMKVVAQKKDERIDLSAASQPLNAQLNAVELFSQHQPTSSLSDHRKILLVRPDSIGDFVIFSGILEHFREIYKDARIHILVQEHIAELAQYCPYIDEVITFDRKKLVHDQAYSDGIIEELKSRKFDTAIHPVYSRDEVGDFLTLNSGANTKIASVGDESNMPPDKKPANDSAYTRLIPASDESILETVRNVEFINNLALGNICEQCTPKVWIEREDETKIDELLGDLNVEKPIVICPFSQHTIKDWPLWKWVELIPKYKDHSILICGSEKNRSQADGLINLSDHNNLHNLCGRITLRQLAALLTKSRLCAGADTGSIHIAAAAGCPQVVITGGGHFGRFMPYSPDTTLVYLPMKCYQCNWACTCRQNYCISQIRVETVDLAVRRVLDTPGTVSSGPILIEEKVNRDSVSGKPARLDSDLFLDSDTEPDIEIDEIDKDSKYLVTAIVSTYNAERFIAGCLDDLEQQTIANRLEIIVINSGSQENEEAIIREFRQRYDNIKYIKTEQRETLYTAWNRAIKAASGKFITTANTDDRHRKDAFEALSNALQEYPDVSLVYGDCYVSTKPNENYEENSKSCIYHYPEFLAVDAILFSQFGPQPMWRKNVHETIGYFDESYKAAGDHDFNIRLAMHFEALHIDEPLGLYLKHSEAISFKDNTMRQEQQRIVFDYRKPEIVEKLYRRVGITADTVEEKAKVFLDMGVRAMECYPPWKVGRAEHHLEFAFQCFNKAAEFRPDWAAAYNNLAVVLGLSGNLGGAGKLLEKAADMTQDSTISFNLKLISDSLPSIQFSSGAKLLLSGLSLPSQKEISLKWKLSESLTQTFLSLPQGNVRSNLEYWQQLQDNQYFEKHQYYAGLKAYGTDNETLAKYTFLSKEMTVVVIGCGYGRETLLIAPRVKHVYGIDVNRTILDKADKFLAERGITNFTSVLAQDWKRVVPSNIDVVYSIVVFQHLTRDLVKDYVHGLAKKLSPNGKFVCQFADLANGTHDAELRPYEPNTRWSKAEIEELIQECGLTQNAIDTKDIPGKGSWHWAFFGKQGARRPAAKILFYFDRIGNLNKISPAGTVIAILNFARALQSSNPDVKIHITGDLVSHPEQYESFEILPLPSADERRKFLAEYDSVFFATHVRYFKGLTKPSGQIWVLWQHCWEADDRVSLSHSSDFDVVMCLSEQHRSSLRNKYFGDEKFITIPNLIDTNVYSPKGVIRNNHSIMFAGGLNPHKCVHILLDAFRLVRQQVKDAELHIYGDGKMWRGGDTYGNELKSIKPEGTYFHGYVDNKDMPQIYSKHSILCLPSKLESFGLVTVEAQACGCVPVVHNVGGVAATLADGETGLLYSPNTPEKLAETIIKALKIVDADPSVRQKAINFVRNTFSINRAAEYISQLWDKINIAKKVNTIRTLLKGNEIEQANLKCKELLQEYPNDPDVLLSQALIMLQQGNKPKANVAIGKLLENFPNYLRALNDCGLTAMKAGDTEKALRYLTKAYTFNPWDKDTVTNCYAMLKTSGRYRDAKILLLNYLTNVGEDAQVLQLFREIDNLIANAGSGTKVVSQEVLNNRQDVYCESNASLPLVSIITPVYNGADYIGQTIESVLAQDYPNFELVIIDDGSTDNTKEVILRYNDGRIRYLYQENKGVSSARNLAIKKAKGQYIMPLDSDDMMTPDFIAKHLAEFEKHPEVDLIYCDVLLIDGSSNPVRIMNKLEYQDRRYLIRDLFRAGHPVIPFRLGIRRSVFDKIGFYDEDLIVGEDYDMMRRFVKADLKAHHLNKPLHLRRIYAESLSRNYSSHKTKCHFDVVRRFTNTFTYEELFPDVEWDEIPVDTRRLHAKCLAVVTYLAIGQDFSQSNSARIYAKTAFEQACSELRDCLKIDPDNRQIRALLQKCELGRQKYQDHVRQAVC